MRHTKYRDPQLRALMGDLRAAVKGTPAARLLEHTEARIVYALRLLDGWDATHARRAEALLVAGRPEAAASTAALIFDEATRHALYDRAPVMADDGADERIARAAELGREVPV